MQAVAAELAGNELVASVRRPPMRVNIREAVQITSLKGDQKPRVETRLKPWAELLSPFGAQALYPSLMLTRMRPRTIRAVKFKASTRNQTGKLFALCLRRGNEVRSHACRCRKVTAILRRLRDPCHKRIRADDAGKARRAETRRTRIRECG